MTINEMHNRLKNIVQNNPQIKQEIENAFLQSNTSLEYLLNLCKIITNKITIWQQTYYNRITQQRYQLYLGRRKNQQDITLEQEKEIMTYATQFIYTLRSFITDTDIDFLFGVTTQDGTETISAIIPQDEVLAHLKATRKKAIGVTTLMQTELIKAQQTKDIEKQRIDHWKLIESLATPKYDTNANYKEVRSKSGRAHRAYQSQKKDFKVYLSFFGKQPMKYYGDSLIYFNNGWLWEWYNNFYYNASDTEYAELESALSHGSIEPLIQNTDFIRGTKQGDFYIEQYKQEVQAKYNNIKIISYNNIREIIYELQRTLLALQNDIHSSEGYTQLYNILDKHFIPDSARIGLDYMEKSTTKLIQDFQNSIKRH